MNPCLMPYRDCLSLQCVSLSTTTRKLSKTIANAFCFVVACWLLHEPLSYIRIQSPAPSRVRSSLHPHRARIGRSVCSEPQSGYTQYSERFSRSNTSQAKMNNSSVEDCTFDACYTEQALIFVPEVQTGFLILYGIVSVIGTLGNIFIVSTVIRYAE